mgnify:CR=1 FL=1
MKTRTNRTEKPFSWESACLAARSKLQPATLGAIEIERHEVTKEEADFARMRASFAFGGGRYVPAGIYTGLKRNGQLWMSDTPDEIGDFIPVVLDASGDVLVTGLGLGCVVTSLLANPDVKTVTVIDIDAEVCSLVGGQCLAIYGDRLRILCADVFTYRPAKGERYDLAYHDIWPTICGDNVEEMSRLRRTWCRRVPKGKQFCWAEYECREQNRRWR